MIRSTQLSLSMAAIFLTGCAITSHSVQEEHLGTATSSDELLSSAQSPGPIQLTRVVAADWAVDRGGMINLDSPAAQAAGLEDEKEPIQIYFYVLQHPTKGTFIVDTGVSETFRDEDTVPVSSLVAGEMEMETLDIHRDTASWLASNGPIDGVFLTHMHLDHIMGLPDVPENVPVYVGPGEPEATSFINMFVQGSTDALIEHLGALHELEMPADPSGRFEGILDVFGDGSLYALHVPGHTPGSMAFLIRTTTGPQLIVGDTSHTVWGWDHDVEPGTYSEDQEANARSLARLKSLERDIPSLQVYLGHQDRSMVVTAR